MSRSAVDASASSAWERVAMTSVSENSVAQWSDEADAIALSGVREARAAGHDAGRADDLQRIKGAAARVPVRDDSLLADVFQEWRSDVSKPGCRATSPMPAPASDPRPCRRGRRGVEGDARGAPVRRDAEDGAAQRDAQGCRPDRRAGLHRRPRHRRIPLDGGFHGTRRSRHLSRCSCTVRRCARRLFADGAARLEPVLELPPEAQQGTNDPDSEVPALPC